MESVGGEGRGTYDTESFPADTVSVAGKIDNKIGLVKPCYIPDNFSIFMVICQEQVFSPLYI